MARKAVATCRPTRTSLPTRFLGRLRLMRSYTPIKNVKYSIENTRVEQKTDYERLIIEIQTDGSIHPEEALKGAANILIQHFMLFSDNTMQLRDGNRPAVAEPVDEETLAMRKVLKTSLA
ncbi:MAG: hypothetical protein WKG07_27315 [Hymenobacter sp.]